MRDEMRVRRAWGGRERMRGGRSVRERRCRAVRILLQTTGRSKLYKDSR